MGEQPIIFYTDEDVNGPAIEWARANGVEIITADDAGLLTMPDDVHFEYALEQGYILVSGNFKHMRPLFYAYLETNDDHPGVIFIKPSVRENSRHIADELEMFYKAGKPDDFKNTETWI